MRRFEYFEPKTIGEAIAILTEYDGETRILAGGTDLLVQMKRKAITPNRVVNVKKIPGIGDIACDNGSLHIGSTATLTSIQKSQLIRNNWWVLSQTADSMASPPIRNLATVGGNIANASPAADMAPPLICLNSKVKLIGAKTERLLPLESFFVGPSHTVMKPDEVIWELQIPNPPPFTFGIYLKFEMRKAIDIAIAGAAVVITFDAKKEKCMDAKICLCAVAPVPLRAIKAEAMLKDEKLNDKLIERASEAAADMSQPISDFRATKQYRKELVKVLVKRAAMRVWELAKSNGRWNT